MSIKNNRHAGFTLIEMVVVVVILAILGGIGFISLSGYFASTRDGVRLSDMNSIYSQLELSRGNSGQYPLPMDHRPISLSGTIMAYQGYAGKSVLDEIRFERGGRDPQDDTYYTYSTDKKRSKAQLMGYFEEYDTSKLSSGTGTLISPYTAEYGSYADRKIGVIGKNICMFAESGTLAPVQETSTGTLDVATTNTGYVVYCDNSTATLGTGSVLSSIISSGSIAYESTTPSVPKTTNLTFVSGDITGFSSPRYFNTISDNMYFTANDPLYGDELWKTDGTASGTTILKDIYPGIDSSNIYTAPYITNFNDSLFFEANDGTNGAELWKSDGTASGTILLKNINTTSDSSSPSEFTVFSGALYFNATDATSYRKLWKTDGTASGTVLIGGPNHVHDSVAFTVFSGALYFNAWNGGFGGDELYKSDGTASGTVLVKDIYPGNTSSSPGNLIEANGVLFFEANDGTSGTELWKTDGTASGTVLVQDIYPGTSDSLNAYSEIIDIDGTLFFQADDGVHGSELWKSDGTASGTVLVKDIYPGIGNSIDSFSEFTDFNGTLYFIADDGVHGSELWKSDGTASGTVLVKDIYEDLESSYVSRLFKMNGSLYFSAENATDGFQLWKTDGTEVGTMIVRGIFNGSPVSLGYYVVHNDTEIYVTLAAPDVPIDGLWKFTP